MNFFHYSGDFFSFAAYRRRPYSLRDETIRDPDVAEIFESLGVKIMKPARKLTRFGRLSRPFALVATLVVAGPLSAQEADPVYTMTVIVDAAHGSKVAAGEYERAIEKITARKTTRDLYSRQTNLCVAYTKTGALDKATAACEAALKLMRGSDRTDRIYLALALSNMGVLQAAKGSAENARKSFRQALELDTGLSAPKINLARLAKSHAPSA